MRYLLQRAAVLTIALELIAVILRYGLHLDATRDTASTVGVLSMGLRIHHGYVGVLLLLLVLLLRRRWAWCRPHLIVWGLALVASDLIHHFLVLWPIEGDPHFDIWYHHP